MDSAVNASPSPAQYSVTVALEAEHQHLLEALDEVRRLLREGEGDAAQLRFLSFGDRLLRHMGAEERVLFPIFEQVTGIPDGPTKALRCAHCAFRKVVRVLKRSLVVDPAESSDAMLAYLKDAFVKHDEYEQQWLYRICNEVVCDDVVRDAILGRLDAWRTSEDESVLEGVPHQCADRAETDATAAGREAP
jgi:hemerythrin-like domain-containing protein